MEAKRFADDCVVGTQYLRVLQANDGDVHVVVRGHDIHEDLHTVGVRFCTSTGGGHSPKTLAALRRLIEAMREDEPYPRQPMTPEEVPPCP